jgi:hypothetical protein
VVDFYEFYEGLQEGWDGPALLVFSDGKRVGARLDRNGLRPARFWRTADDTIYVASEVRQLVCQIHAGWIRVGCWTDRCIAATARRHSHAAVKPLCSI